MIYYESDSLYIQQLVPRDIYDKRGSKSWAMIDPRIVYSIDILQRHFDSKAIINTWMDGGTDHYNGYRTPWCKYGPQLSQHRFGRAVDFTFADYEPDQINEEIVRQRDELNNEKFQYITVLESGIPHVHIDCRQLRGNRVIVIDKSRILEDV